MLVKAISRRKLTKKKPKQKIVGRIFSSSTNLRKIDDRTPLDGHFPQGHEIWEIERKMRGKRRGKKKIWRNSVKKR